MIVLTLTQRALARHTLTRSSPVLLSARQVARHQVLSADSTAHTFSTSPTRYKKRNDVNEPPRDVVDEVPVLRTKGKGPKGAAKSNQGTRTKRGDKEDAARNDDSRSKTTTTNAELEGEQFDQQALVEQMERMVSRCKETTSKMVASHGRVDPALLDNVRVTVPADNSTDAQQSRTASGPSFSLKEYATVGVRDGALLVTCFDPDSLKHVERAIYEHGNGLAPQQIPGGEPGVLRVPVPRPTAETRKVLLADVKRVCENARTSLRTTRQIAMKQINSDKKSKVVSSDEAHKETQKMEEQTKKHTASIDQIERDMQKRIEV